MEYSALALFRPSNVFYVVPTALFIDDLGACQAKG